jgi:hypothetical protein
MIFELRFLPNPLLLLLLRFGVSRNGKGFWKNDRFAFGSIENAFEKQIGDFESNLTMVEARASRLVFRGSYHRIGKVSVGSLTVNDEPLRYGQFAFDGKLSDQQPQANENAMDYVSVTLMKWMVCVTDRTSLCSILTSSLCLS